MNSHRTPLIGTLILLTCLSAPPLLAGCSYRVEYVRAPDFYRQAIRGGAPDRVTLPDGTVRVYVYDGDTRSDLEHRAKQNGKPFEVREVDDRGNVTLRALLPEHVLANTLTCLRNEEYEVLWDQLISEQTRISFDREHEDGFAVWRDIMTRNRLEMMRFLNRMTLELPRSGVVSENEGQGIISFRFSPQIARDFKYRRIAVISEGYGLKLLAIR